MVLRLEVFETDSAATAEGGGTVVLDTVALEEAKLTAYESGYSAGWEDAAAAQSEDRARVSAELARSLQSLSFTYHEARGHILKAIEPLLREVTGRLLPTIARAALPQMVLDTLMPLAAEMVDQPATLVLNPVSRPAIEDLLQKANGLPLILQDEPTMGEGQVYLKLGEIEREVNLDRAVGEITAAVGGFFELKGKD